MNRKIATMTYMVEDYDEAIEYFTEKLNFSLLEDTQLNDRKRWVRIAPAGTNEFCLLLAKADSKQQREAIGNQSGGRVFLFLHTDDFYRDFSHMKAKGIVFKEEPRSEPYGVVAVFEDLYGNLWDLLEPKA